MWTEPRYLGPHSAYKTGVQAVTVLYGELHDVKEENSGNVCGTCVGGTWVCMWARTHFCTHLHAG